MGVHSHSPNIPTTPHQSNILDLYFHYNIVTIKQKSKRSHNALTNLQNKTLPFISIHHNTLLVPSNSWLLTHNMTHPLNFTRVIFQKTDLAHIKPKKYTIMHMMHVYMTLDPIFIQIINWTLTNLKMWKNITWPWIHFKMNAF
jgi:hypothetical protein